MWILDAEGIRGLESRWLETTRLPEALLMERAATAVWDRVRERARLGRLVAVAGPGHNGGDAIAVARMALAHGVRASVVLAASRDRLRPLTRAQLDAFEALGGAASAGDGANAMLDGAAVVVDGLLGIGVSRPPDGAMRAIIDAIAQANAWVVSIDVPSGLVADTGVVPGAVVRADETVTFHGLRWGHVCGRGPEVAGRVHVADIGIPAGWAPSGTAARVADRPRVAAPERSAHKGTRGHVLVVAGSDRFRGAAVLCAAGAMAAGAGLVTVAAPEVVRAAVVAAHPEAMVIDRADRSIDLSRFDALVVGPGLGRSDESAAETRRFVQAFAGRPVVVDADSIDAIAPIVRQPGVAITPHPGELARWLGRSIGEVIADWPRAVIAAQQRLGGVVVAKAAGALVANPSGLEFVAPQSAAVGTGGAGDVLAGAIGALAIGRPLHEAAVAAAWAHQRAASVAAQGSTLGVAASDVAAGLRAALVEASRAG